VDGLALGYLRWTFATIGLVLPFDPHARLQPRPSRGYQSQFAALLKGIRDQVQAKGRVFIPAASWPAAGPLPDSPLHVIEFTPDGVELHLKALEPDRQAAKALE